MANKKIWEFPENTNPTQDMLFLVDQNFITKKLYLSGLTNYIQTSVFTGITGTIVTGFTYDNSNNLTISQNQSIPDLIVNISTMSGLTINGNLSTTNFQLPTNPVNDYVLTSDGSGNGTWQEPNMVTGFTFNTSNFDINISGTKGLNLTQSLSILASDMTVTSGIYNPITGIATFFTNSGNTFNVSGFLTGYTDVRVTGLTYNSSTGVLTLSETDGNIITVSGFLTGITSSDVTTALGYIPYDSTNPNGYITGYTDTYVTGGTYSGGNLILTNNSGGSFIVTGFTSSGGGSGVTGFTYNSANTFTIATTSGDLTSSINIVTGLTSTGDITVNSARIGNGSGNIATNFVFGNSLVLSNNTTGAENVSIGINTLRLNTTGNYNTAVGSGSLEQNINGLYNTAFGYGAGAYIRGSYNTAIGQSTLNAAGAAIDYMRGNFNTAVGRASLHANYSGNSNTAVGNESLRNNTTGSTNVAFGENSLYSNTLGSNNTAIGSGSLSANTIGSLNTALGYGANVLSNNLRNATAIGANARVSTSNSLVLGNSVNVGIGLSNPNSILHIKGTGTTSAGISLRVQDSLNRDMLTVRNDNFVLVGNNAVSGYMWVNGPAGQFGLSNETSNPYLLLNSTIANNRFFIANGSAGSNVFSQINTNNGNWLFGTPNSSVNTQTLSNTKVTIAGSGTTSSGYGLRVQNINYNDILVVRNDGNVGIGTILPTHTLTVSGNSTNILRVVGSGSSTSAPLFIVQGSQGELFSINDSLIGSLFSVNDISGLPILEVFSNNTILMGNYVSPSLNTTVKKTSLSGASTTIYSIPISAYTGAFFDYTAANGTNVKSGSIISVWNSTTSNFTETSTSVGTTSGITFSVNVSGGSASLVSSATTNNWTVKTIVRSI